MVPFIVEAAELVDKRYPIKGMDVWRPYGWKTMRLIDHLTHTEMERTDHDEVNFPLLIPEVLLEKENALVARLKRAREEGVDPDELRMRRKPDSRKRSTGSSTPENELDVPMFLRPTSERPCTPCSRCGFARRPTVEGLPDGQHLPLRDQANAFVHSRARDSLLRSAHGPH